MDPASSSPRSLSEGSHSESAGGFSMKACDFPADGNTLVDVIYLDSEMLHTSRRGRKRLREIQARCQLVSMRLDRSRGCLQVSGSEAAIQAARVQLDSLSGPRKQVTRAMWAELMRTRLSETATVRPVNVAVLQEETGCRVHIERTQCEVRLFGPREQVEKAWARLDELTPECVEESMSVSTANKDFTAPFLQSLACDSETTITLEEGRIIVLGARDAVAQAMEELRLCTSGHKERAVRTTAANEQNGIMATPSPSGLPFIPPTPLPHQTTSKAASMRSQPQPTPPRVGGPKRNTGTSTPFRKAAGTAAGQTVGQFQFGNPAGRHCGSICSECGAAQFCVECGAPVRPVAALCGTVAPHHPHLQHLQGCQPSGMPVHAAQMPSGWSQCLASNSAPKVQAVPWLPQQVVFVPFGSPATGAVPMMCLQNYGGAQGNPSGMTLPATCQGDVSSDSVDKGKYLVPTTAAMGFGGQFVGADHMLSVHSLGSLPTVGDASSADSLGDWVAADAPINL